MIRSRPAASRAPAAPLRGRSAPPDPAARSQESAAIRAREHSEARPQAVNGASRNHLRSRGDAGKRTLRARILMRRAAYSFVVQSARHTLAAFPRAWQMRNIVVTAVIRD